MFAAEMDGVQDKSSRRYASAVERALSLFDTTLQEWADYISFLGRLLKVEHSLLFSNRILLIDSKGAASPTYWRHRYST